MNRLILRLTVVLFFTACGTSGSSNSSRFFKFWYNKTVGTSFDLTNMHFGKNTNYQVAYGNGICQCQLDLAGSIDSGNYSISSCLAYEGSVSTNQCSYLNQNGTYTIRGNELLVCTTGQMECIGYY